MADAGAGSSDGKMVKIKPQDKSLGFDGNNVERFLSDYQLAARLDGASDSDMAQQVRFFVRGEEVKDVLETLDGFEPPNWELLKAVWSLFLCMKGENSKFYYLSMKDSRYGQMDVRNGIYGQFNP
ncbi:hypothetical protein PGT21_007902 [Puccinia graminis f. sp. tritici]|uniref:Uncharacterized protein n=1 Tax=Puccinia graminis f. sp. tritici TaxID=56615 RepID=A0A5B0NPR1_PUCGR|nr:hypothetical protein PGTUg99_026221 [Puccinia graminis f. sp. tritici]KAA1090632.1 hypothetical protein PGT21_007902 [Puccinia graminis f. sp. tritici]